MCPCAPTRVKNISSIHHKTGNKPMCNLQSYMRVIIFDTYPQSLAVFYYAIICKLCFYVFLLITKCYL